MVRLMTSSAGYLPLHMNLENATSITLWHLQLRLDRRLSGEVSDTFSPHDIARLMGFIELKGTVLERTMQGIRLSLNLTRRTLQAHAQVNGTSAANFASSSDCGC